MQVELAAQLNLNCLVLSDNASCVFSIKITKSKTISVLRDAIKDKKRHAFQHINTDALFLWKVDITVDESIAEEYYTEEHSLSPMAKLSRVFLDQPIDEHIHIIVQAPKIPESGMLRLIRRSNVEPKCGYNSSESLHVFLCPMGPCST